jgi:hypothetical protein
MDFTKASFILKYNTVSRYTHKLIYAHRKIMAFPPQMFTEINNIMCSNDVTNILIIGANNNNGRP